MSARPAHARERGFTLVEVAVALGVMSIVLLALVTALSSATRVRTDAALSQNARNEAGRVMDMFALDLAHAVVSTVTMTVAVAPAPASVTAVMTLATGITTTASAGGIASVSREAHAITWSYTGTGKLTRTAWNPATNAMQTVVVIGPRSGAEAGTVPTLDSFSVQRLGTSPVFHLSLTVSRPGVDLDPRQLPAKVRIRYTTSLEQDVKAIDE